MKIALLFTGLLAACAGDTPCGAACTSSHAQGTFASISGGRTLTVAGDSVEIREPDGTLTRYRIQNTIAPQGQESPRSCGARPAGWGRRTYELGPGDANRAQLIIRAAQGHRFSTHERAIVRNEFGVFPSETTRRSDGSNIEVVIDLAGGPVRSAPVEVELDWTLDTPTGQKISETPVFILERTENCNVTPCQATGPAFLPYNLDCY